MLNLSLTSCANQVEESLASKDSLNSNKKYSAQTETYSSNVYDDVNKLVMTIDLENPDPSEEATKKMVDEIKTNHQTSIATQDVLDFRTSFISYLTEDSFTPKQSKFVSNYNDFSKKIYTIIMKGLNDNSSYNDFEVNISNARTYANSIKNSNDREIALAQIEQTTLLTKQLIDKYETNIMGIERISVKCKWYQWACVAGSTAAAVALIATGAGGAVAIIIGGGTVATVAMCCICRCKCSFGGAC